MRLAGVFAAFACVFAISACGTPHLYSDIRDKQGQAAQSAWKSVDLSKVGDQQRQNIDSVLKAQLETQDKLAETIRNFKLRAMLEAPSVQKGLAADVDQSLRFLAGTSDPQALKLSREMFVKHAVARRMFEEREAIFRREGLLPPACDDVKGDQVSDSVAAYLADETTDARHQAEIAGAVEELKRACQADPGTAKVYVPILAGQLGKAKAQASIDAVELQRARDAAAQVEKELTEAVAAKPAASAQAVATTASAANKIGTAVKKLESSKSPYAQRLLSKLRLGEIDKFIAQVTQGEAGKLPAQASEAATAYVLIPKLIDDANVAITNSRKPLATPLLLARDLEQLKLDAAQKEMTLLETRAQLSEQEVSSIYDEIVQLWLAQNALLDPSLQGTLQKTMGDAFEAPQSRQRELLYYSAALYLDAINRLDARWRKLEYERIATYQEVALAYSEVNAQQWSALIGTSVSQVAASAAGGLKPEKINSLINSIGILWIGNGVNK
jgi:hypothetical protein